MSYVVSVNDSYVVSVNDSYVVSVNDSYMVSPEEMQSGTSGGGGWADGVMWHYLSICTGT